MPVYFDDSLGVLAETVSRQLGAGALASGVVIRDTSGQLCFFAAVDFTDEQRDNLARALTKDLGAYARTDRVVAGLSEFGVSEALSSPEALLLRVKSLEIRLIDRRLVGADWLRAPAAEADGPPRIVFASLKGGVGRSTALSVVASDAASRGRRVLAIDLDLEAPGIGTMLLDNKTTPTFGMIDALAESCLSPLDQAFIGDLIGPSPLTDRGRIDVLPAFGLRSLQNPGDVLAKLARAYGEAVRPDGSTATILDRVAMIVDSVSRLQRYDLILMDSRAGLHETVASALLGLGAQILCFGVDEPQTFQGYNALFSHIARYANDHAAASEWLARVNLVHAKAPADADLREDFSKRFSQLIGRVNVTWEQRQKDVVPLPDGFSDVAWNEELSDAELGLADLIQDSEVIPILYDSTFLNFAPHQRRDQILERVYKGTFGALLTHVQRVSGTSDGSRA